jgi:hypothetical protein
MAALASNRDEGALSPLGDHQIAEDPHETSTNHATENGVFTAFFLFLSSLPPSPPLVIFMAVFLSFLFFLSFFLFLSLSSFSARQQW